jgi:hypothetical protein
MIRWAQNQRAGATRRSGHTPPTLGELYGASAYVYIGLWARLFPMRVALHYLAHEFGARHF